MRKRTSTSSAGSAASRSRRKRTASKPSRSAKAIPAAGTSLPKPGPESPVTVTSEPSAASSIGEQLGFSLEGCPVSQPPEPGSNEAREMTAGSGRRLFGFCPRSGPLGCYSRALLESRTWGSTESLLTWKAKATKSGRYLIFRLAPLTPRTSDTDTGLWPTTMARDVKGQMFGPRDRMDYVPNVLKAIYPTPTKVDGKGRKYYGRGDLALPRQVKAIYQTPAAHQFSKRRQVGQEKREELLPPGQVKAMFPTPEKASMDGGHKNRSGDRKDELLLGGLVSTYPTPTKADGEGGPGNQGREGGENLRTKVSGLTISGPLSQTEKFGVRLMILSAWLMGYPWSYLKHWLRKKESRKKKSGGKRSVSATQESRGRSRTARSSARSGTQSSGKSQRKSSRP